MICNEWLLGKVMWEMYENGVSSVLHSSQTRRHSFGYVALINVCVSGTGECISCVSFFLFMESQEMWFDQHGVHRDWALGL